MKENENRAVCEILDELARLSSEERKIQSRRDELMESLRHAGEEEWDWISVKEAASLLQMSTCYVYNQVNAGVLSTKRLGSVVRVRKSEVMAINDKYPA
jgi:excisionase family DNA binding protein